MKKKIIILIILVAFCIALISCASIGHKWGSSKSKVPCNIKENNKRLYHKGDVDFNVQKYQQEYWSIYTSEVEIAFLQYPESKEHYYNHIDRYNFAMILGIPSAIIGGTSMGCLALTGFMSPNTSKEEINRHVLVTTTGAILGIIGGIISFTFYCISEWDISMAVKIYVEKCESQ